MPVITINSVTWGTQMIGKKTFNGFLDVVARLRYVYTYWWCELFYEASSTWWPSCRGTGWMNHTKSPCYACGAPDVQPTRILPPVRHRTHTQKQQLSHSCTAPNCYNRAGK